MDRSRFKAFSIHFIFHRLNWVYENENCQENRANKNIFLLQLSSYFSAFSLWIWGFAIATRISSVGQKALDAHFPSETISSLPTFPADALAWFNRNTNRLSAQREDSKTAKRMESKSIGQREMIGEK